MYMPAVGIGKIGTRSILNAFTLCLYILLTLSNNLCKYFHKRVRNLAFRVYVCISPYECYIREFERATYNHIRNYM